MTGQSAGWRGWLALALLFVMLAAGCEGVGGTALPFTTLKQNFFLSNEEGEPRVFVSATERERDDLAFLIDRGGTDPILDQLYQIDYTQFFSVFIESESFGSSGFSITAQEVVRSGDTVTIRATLRKPASGEQTLQAFTQPYHLITVAKEGTWGKPIRFRLVVDGNQVTETTHTIP
jgi:hypothetical protein